MTDLRRELSLLDATMINVGSIIGSAIFVVPASMAAGVRSPGLLTLIWIVGGLVSLLGALCIAELAAMFPEAGGQMAYLREAFGPVWGFLYAWSSSLVILPASIAAVAMAFATYLGSVVPLGDTGIKTMAVASIVALTALNCLGVRQGAITQNILTGIKLAALGALIVLALALSGGSAGQRGPLFPAAPGLGAIGVAMVAALWAYDGWIEITYVGSEVKDPDRNLPRSIIYSTVIVIVLYVLASVAYVYALGIDRMAVARTVASDAAGVVLGTAGAGFVALAIMISTLGANNGLVLTGARIPYAMARAGWLFAWLGRVHPRFLTPVAALLVQGAISVALALSGTYDQLFTYVVFVSWLFYAMSCGAVLWLRRTMPNRERPYRAWGYPLSPIAFIAFSAWIVVTSIVETPREAVVGAAIVAAGLPVYWVFRRRNAFMSVMRDANAPKSSD